MLLPDSLALITPDETDFAAAPTSGAAVGLFFPFGKAYRTRRPQHHKAPRGHECLPLLLGHVTVPVKVERRCCAPWETKNWREQDHLLKMAEKKYATATWNVVKYLNNVAPTPTAKNVHLLGP